MRRPWLPFFLLFVVCYAPVLAQGDFEDLLEHDGSTSDRGELLERIEALKEQPIDINIASADDLQALPWFSPVLAHRVVEYRKGTGRFTTTQQLLNVSGIDEILLERILPLVTVRTRPRGPSVSSRIRTRMIHSGSADEFKGDDMFFRDKIYTRGDVTVSDRLTIHIVTEKDPGEISFNDHAAYSLCIRRFHMLDSILLGHFRAGFGQGLVLGDYSGSYTGASIPRSLKKKKQGLQVYTSTFEACPFFGGACAGTVGALSFSLFGSQATMDATLNDDGTVSSIYESGLHRTENERSKRNLLEEKIYGGRLSCDVEHAACVGVTVYHSRYNRAFDPRDVERKRYTFRGRKNGVGGLDVDVCWRRLNVYGEMAKTFGAGQGMLMGAVIDFGPIEIDALVRTYAEDFYNFHNDAFAVDPEETRNESGTLLAMVCKPHCKTTIKTYVDRVRNPWRRYYEKMPPTREEFFAQIEHRFPRRIDSTMRIRVKTKETNKKVDDESKNVFRRQVNFRGQIDWRYSRRGRARGRVEHIRLNYPDLMTEESGWLFLTDLRLALGEGITLSGRATCWSTDSYDSRLYAYEHDLPGVMTNTALYGEGWGWYALVTLKTSRGIRFALKYASTHFIEDDREDDHRFGIQFEFNQALRAKSKTQMTKSK